MASQRKKIDNEDLVFHVLNVGQGDTILVEFPADQNGQRSYGLVDCYNSLKTRAYLGKLRKTRAANAQLEFLCATHPHLDHILGIRSLLKDREYQPKEFWDSGFRHNSKTYLEIMKTLDEEKIKMVRISSGMEMYYGKVQVTALAPSIALRNRYATYGVDINNASIVLRFENHKENVLLIRSREYAGGSSLEAEREAGNSVVILAGDAEFDSWSHIIHEFPRLETTSDHEPLIAKMINYLSCAVVKVAHHGSMHSAPLDLYEIMKVQKAIISNKQKKSKLDIGGRKLERDLFPHASATIALEESGTEIVTTDGSYEGEKDTAGNKKDPDRAHPGSTVVVVPPGGKARWIKLHDEVDQDPDPPSEV